MHFGASHIPGISTACSQSPKAWDECMLRRKFLPKLDSSASGRSTVRISTKITARSSVFDPISPSCQALCRLVHGCVDAPRPSWRAALAGCLIVVSPAWTDLPSLPDGGPQTHVNQLNAATWEVQYQAGIGPHTSRVDVPLATLT